MAIKKSSKKKIKFELEIKSTSEIAANLENRYERILKAVFDFLNRIPHRLNVTRQDKIQMYETIDADANYLSFPYWIFIITSCGIATLGLITNSPAVIIGAMLVSPLMAPITGLGMSIAVNDLYLGIKSLVTITASILLAVLTSALITIITSASDATAEIIGRTNPTLLDLFIAIFCGIVAGFSSVRSRGKVVLGSVAPGAAIGVALMPPLCVTGFAMGLPFNFSMMWGGFLLFLTNLFAIVLTTSLFYYFIFKRVDTATLLAETKLERKNEALFKSLHRRDFYKKYLSIAPSRRRFLYPAILILVISYPLMQSLMFLRDKDSVYRNINKFFESREGINILKGPDRLVYTREGVSGTVIFSGTKINSRSLEEELNKEINSKFKNFDSKISLIRVAGDADIQAMRPKALTFETNPNTLYDAARDKYASELVKRAFELIQLRFPSEAGIVLDVKILYNKMGMDTIEIEYAGKKISGETKNLLQAAMKNDLKALQGEFLNLNLKYISELNVKKGCARKSEIEDSIDSLDSVFQYLKRNEFLYLNLSVKESIQSDIQTKITKEKLNDRIIITTRKNGCHLEYSYTSK